MCIDSHLNWGWDWHHETGLRPPVKYFYWPFQGGTSFVDHLCYLCLVFVMLTCLFIAPWGYLLGKGLPVGSGLWCLIVFVNFPCGVLDQVWYLIVSIPDLCHFFTLIFHVNSTHIGKYFLIFKGYCIYGCIWHLSKLIMIVLHIRPFS